MTERSPRNLVFGNIWFMGSLRAISAVAELLVAVGNETYTAYANSVYGQ